jgi:signal recognition particle receptor subunit beta
MVLKSADGVVFVADSQLEQRKNNNYSYRDLLNNLRFNNLGGIPIIIQFNKRDLPNIISNSEVESFASKLGTNVFKASAINGDGVLETFAELIKVSYDRLNSLYQFDKKFGIYKHEILKGVFSNIKNG